MIGFEKLTFSPSFGEVMMRPVCMPIRLVPDVLFFRAVPVAVATRATRKDATVIRIVIDQLNQGLDWHGKRIGSF